MGVLRLLVFGHERKRYRRVGHCSYLVSHPKWRPAFIGVDKKFRQPSRTQPCDISSTLHQDITPLEPIRQSLKLQLRDSSHVGIARTRSDTETIVKLGAKSCSCHSVRFYSTSLTMLLNSLTAQLSDMPGQKGQMLRNCAMPILLKEIAALLN